MTHKKVPEPVQESVVGDPGHVALSLLVRGGQPETLNPRYQLQGAKGGSRGVSEHLAIESCNLLMEISYVGSNSAALREPKGFSPLYDGMRSQLPHPITTTRTLASSNSLPGIDASCITYACD